MSFESELDKIPQQKLASDMPDIFEAEIISIVKDTKKQGIGAGQPILKFELLVGGEIFTTNYRIPKALTGKGQYDRLLDAFIKLGYPSISKSLEGKLFSWKREELGGSVKGNARHYPIKELGMVKKEINLIGKKK